MDTVKNPIHSGQCRIDVVDFSKAITKQKLSPLLSNVYNIFMKM